MHELDPSFLGPQDVPCPECRDDPEGHCALCQDTRWVLRDEALEYWFNLYEQNRCEEEPSEFCRQIQDEIEALRAPYGEDNTDVLEA